MYNSIGRKVKVTWTTYGEQITDRKGKPVHMSPIVTTKSGTITKVYTDDWGTMRVYCNEGSHTMFSFNPTGDKEVTWKYLDGFKADNPDTTVKFQDISKALQEIMGIKVGQCIADELKAYIKLKGIRV